MRGHGPSARLTAIQAPVIPVVGRWSAETPGVISLGQGVVSYGPPAAAIETAHRFGASLADHRYGPGEGQPELVDAIRAKLAAENGIRVDTASRIVVTAGSNLAFMHAVLAIGDTGDEILLPTPYYFNHEMAIAMAGLVPVPVATTREYQLDLDALAAAITPRTRAIVTVSPNNPTGAVYPESALRAVNTLCRDRGIFHIHDAAYEYFVYGTASHFSPGSIEGAEPHTISLFTLSKAFGMASWRIGYMVFPEALWGAVDKIQDTLLISAPQVSQAAAAAALRVGRPYAAAHLGGLDATRRRVHAALSDGTVPCEAPLPEGAFYFFVRVRSALSSMALAERLVRDHRVEVIPGSAFGDTSSCSIRVSYGALDPGTLAEGLERLVRGLRALGTS
jgi:aspartate/methionine/tyrosine aminotransferase